MLHQAQYIDFIKMALAENTFVKLSLSNYKGTIEGLKNCYIKKIIIKGEEKLSFTFRYQTKDIVKNYGITDALKEMEGLLGITHFCVSNLLTTKQDAVLEFLSSEKTTLRKLKPTQTKVPSLDHNTAKNRLISTNGKSYLHQLNITDEKGQVHKNAQDKYKQINHYIELLSPLLKNLPEYPVLNIADMGAGKGYLTFALYDYITNELKQNASVKGVEYRKDLVELCNGITQQSNFDRLQFVQGTINDYDATGTNVLIALHACDTATDDAIQKGITAGAD